MKNLHVVAIVVITAALAGYAGYITSESNSGWSSVSVHTSGSGRVELHGPGYDVDISGDADFELSD